MHGFVIPPTAFCHGCGAVVMQDTAICPYCDGPPALRSDEDQGVRDLVAAARLLAAACHSVGAGLELSGRPTEKARLSDLATATDRAIDRLRRVAGEP